MGDGIDLHGHNADQFTCDYVTVTCRCRHLRWALGRQEEVISLLANQGYEAKEIDTDP